MAAFEMFQDMHDLKLKPRLLRTLLREHVPDEKHTFSNPSGLLKVVSTIQSHKLLSEASTKSMEHNQADKWKSVVNDWIDRLMELASSNMPDKCWAGVCLMGLTFQECSSDRFLSSYSSWFHKLLPYIQHPPDSQILKVAACASASDLLTRLAKFPNAKKDGHSLAGKLVQPVIKLLNDSASEAEWEGSLLLLHTIIMTFPAALNNYQDKIETAIVQKIFSAKPIAKILEKLCHCLALLPRAKGDESSWSIMMHKLLVSINTHLNGIFQGLEEESKGREALKLLVPPRNNSPPSLGGLTGALDDTTWESESLVVSRLCALMICCCTMLTSSYDVQVNVPVRSLLALVERVLMVDGSLSNNMLPFMTAIHQELICGELQNLHSYGLEILVATIKSIRSQLLPHAASVVRLVTRYFRKCASPELRIKVYLVAKILLTSMGVGMAMHLAQEVVTNAFADLEKANNTSSSEKSTLSNGATLVTFSRKRKRPTASEVDAQAYGGLEAGVSQNHPGSPISLKIAALEALETLLTVGGALRSESWRLRVDSLVMTTASNTCNRGWMDGAENLLLPKEFFSILEDFQLAAFRALLASLLSPARVRPAFLAQGLELFRTGKRETGTRLADFCAHALLCLEVLIHPRALPLDDYPSSMPKQSDAPKHGFPESMSLGSRKYDTQNADDIRGRSDYGPEPDVDDDDDLYKRWLENGSAIDSPENHHQDPNNMQVECPLGSKNACIEERPSERGSPKAAEDDETQGNKDVAMVESRTILAETTVEELASGPKDVEIESSTAREKGYRNGDGALNPIDFKTESEMAGERGSENVDGAASNAVEAFGVPKVDVSNDSDDGSLGPCPEITFFSESESD